MDYMIHTAESMAYYNGTVKNTSATTANYDALKKTYDIMKEMAAVKGSPIEMHMASAPPPKDDSWGPSPLAKVWGSGFSGGGSKLALAATTQALANHGVFVLSQQQYPTPFGFTGVCIPDYDKVLEIPNHKLELTSATMQLDLAQALLVEASGLAHHHLPWWGFVPHKNDVSLWRRYFRSSGSIVDAAKRFKPNECSKMVRAQMEKHLMAQKGLGVFEMWLRFRKVKSSIGFWTWSEVEARVIYPGQNDVPAF